MNCALVFYKPACVVFTPHFFTFSHQQKGVSQHMAKTLFLIAYFSNPKSFEHYEDLQNQKSYLFQLFFNGIIPLLWHGAVRSIQRRTGCLANCRCRTRRITAFRIAPRFKRFGTEPIAVFKGLFLISVKNITNFFHGLNLCPRTPS